MEAIKEALLIPPPTLSGIQLDHLKTLDAKDRPIN